MDSYNIGVNYGWVCPKCGRAFAPTVIMCPYCGAEEHKWTSTTTGAAPVKGAETTCVMPDQYPEPLIVKEKFAR